MSLLFYLTTMNALPFMVLFILMITHRFGLRPQPIAQAALEPAVRPPFRPLERHRLIPRSPTLSTRFS